MRAVRLGPGMLRILCYGHDKALCHAQPVVSSESTALTFSLSRMLALYVRAHSCTLSNTQPCRCPRFLQSTTSVGMGSIA